LKKKEKEFYGNDAFCSEGNIPMRRLTLGEMTRFPSLRHFFAKTPLLNLTTTPSRRRSQADTHAYSYTNQNIANWGGSSALNLWSPYIDQNNGEVFSLSQQWYTAGDPVQTAECGWQNYPGKYGSENSVLFIFATPDGYQTVCYNLDCPAFVQTNSGGNIGGTFSEYSVSGGPQYEVTIGYQFDGNNWWFSEGEEFLGYYPGSFYEGGPMTQYSSLIEFGSEGVGRDIWPPEGSGNWSSAGWTYAAYQRQVLYYVPETSTPTNTSLSADIPDPTCYTITGPYLSGSWGSYFFEGGPGGPGC